MIAKYVSILVEGMHHSADVRATDSPRDFKAICQKMEPDIVHCHGCWQYAIVNAVNTAYKNGARIILSPHGQLEPWILEEKSLQEKLHKTLLWQKSSVERAYAIIVFGNMEQRHLKQLKWNPRIEIIRNTLITNSITPQEMCSQTFAIYQKVLDSNVLEQMDETAQRLLACIIKAEHENIRNYVDYGISVLGLDTPSLDTSKIAAFFPNNWQPPLPLKEIIGEYKGDETDYLVRMIRQIEKQPLLLHLVELARELRRDTVDDDMLQQDLEEKKLLKYASRLLQILQEQTRLEEGYMPLPSTNDRGTQQIRKLITNQMTI